MTVYAVVEDFDNGRSYSDNSHYENQLIGIFCDKPSAMKHISDGVHEELFTGKNNYYSMIIYRVNDESSLLDGSLLTRRICKITTEDSCNRLSGDFILSQNSSSFNDYV